MSNETATATPTDELMLTSQTFDHAAVTSVAISSADHGYMKPHPAIFHAALEAMAVPAHAAVMVGDMYRPDRDPVRDEPGLDGTGAQAVTVTRSNVVAV